MCPLWENHDFHRWIFFCQLANFLHNRFDFRWWVGELFFRLQCHVVQTNFWGGVKRLGYLINYTNNNNSNSGNNNIIFINIQAIHTCVCFADGDRCSSWILCCFCASFASKPENISCTRGGHIQEQRTKTISKINLNLILSIWLI